MDPSKLCRLISNKQYDGGKLLKIESVRKNVPTLLVIKSCITYFSDICISICILYRKHFFLSYLKSYEKISNGDTETVNVTFFLTSPPFILY
jgi:hypothetical protein